MIVEKLTNEDFDNFFKDRIFPDRFTKCYGKQLKISEARSIRRGNNFVEIDFGLYGTFYFYDFDFCNCYYDNEYYTLAHIRSVNREHDARWIEFMSNHPIFGDEWKKLFVKILEKEKNKSEEKDLNI